MTPAQRRRAALLAVLDVLGGLLLFVTLVVAWVVLA